MLVGYRRFAVAKARIEISLARFSPELRRFVDERVAEAVHSGMSVFIKKGKAVRSGGYLCGGTCCPAQLRVAWNGPASVTTVLHELCHAEQIIHHPDLWYATMVRGKDSVTWIDEWIKGKVELSKRRLDNYFKRLVAMERDCEARVLKNIETYGITDISIPAYTVDANTYLLFHAEIMRNKRKWMRMSRYIDETRANERVPSDRLYSVKEIMRRMS
jgi:hypothetical protein